MRLIRRLVVRARWFHWFPEYQRRVVAVVLVVEIVAVAVFAGMYYWWVFK